MANNTSNIVLFDASNLNNLSSIKKSNNSTSLVIPIFNNKGISVVKSLKSDIDEKYIFMIVSGNFKKLNIH